MEWRAHVTSIGLTIAAAGALWYAYADRGSVTEAEKKTREGNVFVAWRREDVTRIAVDHGSEHIVLERAKDDAGDAEWWMRAPIPEKADSEASDRLASAFELAAVIRKLAPDVQVPGLDAPRARGQIDMGRVTYRFALAGDAPTPAGAAYLHVEGGATDGATVVVARDLVTAILQGADTYRSRSFVPYVSVQLSALEIKGASDLRLERGDDVSFRLVTSGLRASRAKLDAVWGAFGEMRAEAFVSDEVAEPLVAAPKATITMTPLLGAPGTPSSATPGVIRVGGACPGSPDDVVVVRDSPTHLVACAPKGILTGLATTAEELVDRHLFAAHPDEVAELRIESLAHPSDALELARKESGWREKVPVARDLPEAEAAAATQLVASLAGAEGTDPRKSTEPFEAKWRVTIRRTEVGRAGEGATEVVELGALDAAGDGVVRRAFDGARLRVGAAVARRLIPRAVALRGPEVWALPVEGVPVAQIETRCDGVEQTVVHEGDAWTLRAPEGFAADNASILELVDAVTRARAKSWVADGDDGHFGFEGAPCSVALTLRADGGERVARVEIGRAADDGVYARTSEGPAVFVAGADLRDRARAWLVDLHDFARANVESVTLVRDGKYRAFGADGGADETADEVLAAVNVLRADAVVHLGAARAGEGFAHPSLVVTARAGDGGPEKRIVFGAETADGKSRYARVDGIDATYAVDKGRVRALFDRF